MAHSPLALHHTHCHLILHCDPILRSSIPTFRCRRWAGIIPARSSESQSLLHWKGYSLRHKISDVYLMDALAGRWVPRSFCRGTTAYVLLHSNPGPNPIPTRTYGNILSCHLGCFTPFCLGATKHSAPNGYRLYSASFLYRR